MEFFKSLIGILAYASLAFSLTAAYLKINKIWKRKHHAEVADSVSISGNVITIIPYMFFALNYMFVNQWQGLIDAVIWIIFCIVSILIGSRLWVKGNRDKTFWTRLREALKLERSEVGHLATSFFSPSSADIIIEIFAHFAYIDRDLTDRERELIQSFGDTWHLEVDWSKHQHLAGLEQPVSFVKTRHTVARYLKTSPPPDQVAQLIDVLHALVKVDEVVSAEEKFMLEEVHQFLLDYMDDSESRAEYTVVIAPQDHGQDVAIASLLPDVQKTEVAGGSGYKVGSFYTQDYADMICNQYRALGFFTIDMVHEEQAIA